MVNVQMKQAILQIYKDCNIKSFPISCSSILTHYQFKVYSYSFLHNKNKELHTMCRKYSDDAFTYGTILCYNDAMPRERIRFSLMHELGHQVLDTENEVAANQFASNILAPRSILIKSGLKDIQDIARLFFISKEAASYAKKDALSAYGNCDADNAILEHFYDPVKQITIYHISECPICGSTIFNSIKNTCIQCKKLTIKSK